MTNSIIDFHNELRLFCWLLLAFGVVWLFRPAISMIFTALAMFAVFKFLTRR